MSKTVLVQTLVANTIEVNAETKLLYVLIFIMTQCLVGFYRGSLNCPQKYPIEGSVVSVLRKSSKLNGQELLYLASDMVYKDCSNHQTGTLWVPAKGIIKF